MLDALELTRWRARPREPGGRRRPGCRHGRRGGPGAACLEQARRDRGTRTGLAGDGHWRAVGNGQVEAGDDAREWHLRGILHAPVVTHFLGVAHVHDDRPLVAAPIGRELRGQFGGRDGLHPRDGTSRREPSVDPTIELADQPVETDADELVDGLVRGVSIRLGQHEDEWRRDRQDPADVRGERVAELHGQRAGDVALRHLPARAAVDDPGAIGDGTGDGGRLQGGE
jgi:hypothetical protein